MNMTRRQWLTKAGASTLALTLGARAGASPTTQPRPIRFGMCDWCLGRQNPTALEMARDIGLDGVQVSLGTRANNMWLRRTAVQKQYRQTAARTGMTICSLAIGDLNHVPLMSEPRAAIWVADSIKVAQDLSVPNILLAFFLKGELKQDHPEDMRRVTEVLQELAPRAEQAGVVLGIESYLSLEGHLRILNAVNSPAVQVYYDFYNAHATKGYDYHQDVTTLGRDRICEVHFKEGPHYLGTTGIPDWAAVTATLRNIRYDGWVVLETSCPTGDPTADTRKNLAYAQGLFRTD